MPTLIGRHTVKDFAAWKSFEEERKSNILANGATAVRTFQDVDNPNSVLLLIDVEDMEKFEALMTSERAKDAQERHGVIGPVILSREV